MPNVVEAEQHGDLGDAARGQHVMVEPEKALVDGVSCSRRLLPMGRPEICSVVGCG